MIFLRNCQRYAALLATTIVALFAPLQTAFGCGAVIVAEGTAPIDLTCHRQPNRSARM